MRLTQEQLAECSEAFAERVRAGLAADGDTIKGLITYAGARRPEGSREAVVVDLGGTRVRAARVATDGNRPRLVGEPVAADLPLVRGVPLAPERYFAVQTELVERLRLPAELPLGYCFSYPAASLPDGDARLIKWTKEVFVPDTEGRRVGSLLRNALARRGVPVSSVTVVNDTVAALLAGFWEAPTDGAIGLIVGTGTNTAVWLPRKSIPKFPDTVSWSGALPVNLESGNFHPPHLGPWDDAVDAASDAPGQQRFEKAVSGAYLGRILAAARPDLHFDPELGSKGVVALANQREAPGTDVAQAVLDRSAQLVAASLAGLVLVLGTAAQRVRIVAEGGLYWGAPGYADRVDQELRALLDLLGRGEVTPTIVSYPHANLYGTALAALNQRPS